MDVLRTVAHELTHKRQHERENVIGTDAGETGSQYENEANARAGVLMRDYARLHPEYFAHGQADKLHDIEEGWKEKAAGIAAAACIAGTPGCATPPNAGQTIKDIQTVGRTAQTVKNMSRADVNAETKRELELFARSQTGDHSAQNLSRLYQLQKKIKGQQPPQRIPQNEGASGYIPTKAQAKDPRYSMALTMDIKPGQVGKEANKLKLKTDKQGQPQIARANGLFEKLALELSHFKKKGTLVEAEEQLDEVKMSPSALMQWAKSPEAQGIRAGFEAELIFRDTTNGDDDDTDMEPDYDYDERARSVLRCHRLFQRW
jgi:hypothetical protein